MAILHNLGDGQALPLRGKVALIGRDTSCDIVVKSPKTSARHAMIVNAGGAYFVEDLDSVNGTCVNGNRIRHRAALKQGDRIDVPGLTVILDMQDGLTSSSEETVRFDEEPGGDLSSIISSCDIGGDLHLAVRPEAKLRAVLEISKCLSSTLDLKTVLPKTLDSLFSIFPHADCGFILLRDELTGQMIPRAVKHRHEPRNDSVMLSRSIINHVMRTGQAILSADAGHDTRFDPGQSINTLKIHSIMCVPLLGQEGKCLGMIQIDTRNHRNQFQQDDLDLLACTSVLVARTVELARSHQERRDLEAATKIQQSFLPAGRPKHAQLRFFDYYSPAQHVGGDYFDYIPLPGGRLAVALGDVSGKGISAALLMARVSAAARFTLATAPTVASAVQELNRVLLRAHSEERFVTFVVAVLDVEQSQLTLVNAGHIPPLLRRSGQAVKGIGDEIVGLPLAVMDRPYEELVIPFEVGDILVLCTDGVTEARNTKRDLYGGERLQKVVAAAAADVEKLGYAVLADVRQFADTCPQNDDLTIVCFGRQM
ncbi:MAG: SpoIIE family protein phosphatase [Planctomycetes bacterium]|nr:SpoIIE family protein phosphatase [Planctomycetota bacterium]